ncbi:MAG TPA: 16S rRNA (cytidine(1402)-2'-O)-methyltransferase, partial [Fusibacter sp.]|nr:16S rRNA (cytidine(1402)-2'-O)-methyltransferase [Fusibacter sp.]
HFQISKPLHSYHEHNMIPAGKEIVEKIKRGERIALVTDAGMPGISDPGEALVKLCIENELDFEVIPGVTAFTTALVGSGLDTSRFVFEAFLSRDKKQKRALLEKIKKETRTILFYESPHRLKETLKVMQEVLGDRKLVLARELTKKFEEFRRGTIESIMTYYETHDIKGEIVLVVEGYQETESDLIVYNPQESVKQHVMRLIAEGIDKKEAMKIVATERKIKKTEVYAVLIED